MSCGLNQAWAIVNEGVAERGRLDGVVANAGICPTADHSDRRETHLPYDRPPLTKQVLRDRYAPRRTRILTR
jgi:hypothetical protein